MLTLTVCMEAYFTDPSSSLSTVMSWTTLAFCRLACLTSHSTLSTSKQTSRTPSPCCTRWSPNSRLPGRSAVSKTKTICEGRRQWHHNHKPNNIAQKTRTNKYLVLSDSIRGGLSTTGLQAFIREGLEAKVGAIPKCGLKYASSFWILCLACSGM